MFGPDAIMTQDGFSFGQAQSHLLIAIVVVTIFDWCARDLEYRAPTSEARHSHVKGNTKASHIESHQPIAVVLFAPSNIFCLIAQTFLP
jgi:hypothetical protein